jgi:hypothetical protein
MIVLADDRTPLACSLRITGTQILHGQLHAIWGSRAATSAVVDDEQKIEATEDG